MTNRREFINPIPEECINSKNNAPSTLTCKNDIWGTMDGHYRYINQRNSEGKIIMREDNPKKPLKTLKLVGEPHIEWHDYFIKIRINHKQSMWYKHWPTAANMYHFGKLPTEAIEWLKEEGAKRFSEGLLPIQNNLGKYTLGVSVLLSLGVLAKNGNQITLKSDLEAAKEAVQKAVEVKAVDCQNIIQEEE
jgi:hypothetical protein